MQTVQSVIGEQGVLTLRMNRPQVHNAFDPAMIRELIATLQEAEKNNEISLVVITGTGSCFSAGADMNWMRSLVDASQEDNERDALQLASLMRTLNYLSKPTIARINGAAYGGGLGLIAACDIAIAVENAQFGLTEVRLGLAPAVISPYVIRRIGERNARHYFLTGERFDCRQAQAIGLIQQCVTTEQLDATVESTIKNLLKGGPLAVATCKQLIYAVAGHDAEAQKSMDEYTSKVIAGMRIMDEGQEGLAAFLEKRKPRWLED
ncbi:MAG: enoyl-CoA hydratase-related protein [Gammaproteobacteria bacterium]|nr:MAG: enoyl-CoA hydratase-related protein [Gammaproteobacteria bacterium]